jgi:arylsulfatase A-like enzyme
MHGDLKSGLKLQCMDTDQPSAALIKDLEARGLLDETLIIWGGEFGRTVYSQGDITSPSAGRDHHGRCFSIWMAGAGSKKGHVHGDTDDFCYNITKDGVHIHDFAATVLQQLGIDHTKLTYKYQGRDFRLTDVAGEVVKGILA